MKLVMTLLVRDEEDVLEQNLLYHLAHGVDFVIVTDNNSVDGSRGIIECFVRLGVVHLIDEQADNYDQSRWVTRMARMAHDEFGADWVMNVDADEFWWPRSGDLKSVLEAVPTDYGIVKAPIYDFLPLVDESKPVIHRMTVRQRLPKKVKVCHRAEPDVVVAQGNHRLSESSLADYPRRSGLSVLHFPARSYQQFERKVINGARSYARNTQLPASVGAHWRQLYAEYEAGRLRGHYRDERVVTRGRIAKGIATGQLVIDRRLRRFFVRQHLPLTKTPIGDS